MQKYYLAKRESHRLSPYEYSDDEIGGGSAIDDSDEDDVSNSGSDENSRGHDGDDDKRRKRMSALKKRQLSRTLALMRKRGLIAKRYRHNFWMQYI